MYTYIKLNLTSVWLLKKIIPKTNHDARRTCGSRFSRAVRSTGVSRDMTAATILTQQKEILLNTYIYTYSFTYTAINDSLQVYLLLIPYGPLNDLTWIWNSLGVVTHLHEEWSKCMPMSHPNPIVMANFSKDIFGILL